MWWRDPLRRAYFRLIGLLLLTVPLFAGLRYMEHQLPVCGPNAIDCMGWYRVGLWDGAFYVFWQGGVLHGDVWPVALALLAVAVFMDAALILRARRTDG